MALDASAKKRKQTPRNICSRPWLLNGFPFPKYRTVGLDCSLSPRRGLTGGLKTTFLLDWMKRPRRAASYPKTWRIDPTTPGPSMPQMATSRHDNRAEGEPWKDDRSRKELWDAFSSQVNHYEAMGKGSVMELLRHGRRPKNPAPDPTSPAAAFSTNAGAMLSTLNARAEVGDVGIVVCLLNGKTTCLVVNLWSNESSASRNNPPRGRDLLPHSGSVILGSDI
jgi:hypothetical protein